MEGQKGTKKTGINFAFARYVVAADIRTVWSAKTGEDLDVSDVSDAEIAAKLESGEWMISLGDFLYCHRKNEVGLSNFEPNRFED